MSAHATFATAARVLRQLRHDPRTIALLVVVPALLLALLYYMFQGPDGRATFDRLAPVMVCVFPFVVMFLVTSIAMLRERRSGTLERLLTTPLSKVDLLAGYGLAFGSAALVQSVVITAVVFGVLSVPVPGGVVWAVLVAVLTALLGTALGLLCSAFSRTEFQAVQLLPVVVVPQLLLCGLFVARGAMAGWLDAVSTVMPLTWAVAAIRELGSHQEIGRAFTVDAVVVGGAALLALLLAAGTLRRRTA